MKKRSALIATLPKSGTWYSMNFFWCYDQFLKHDGSAAQEDFQPDLLGALRDRKILNRSTHADTLGIDELFVCHTVCPGFRESGDARLALWEGLHFPLPYNGGEPHIRDCNSWRALNPGLNPHARIIYLYRNPMDHCVSLYRHAQTHVNTDFRHKRLPDGTRVAIRDLHDFVFDFGILGAFIKHYYPFRQMQRRYPDQVMLMSYEQLVSEPKKAFEKMLCFMQSAPDTLHKRRLFEKALALCSRESLVSIESRLKRSMAGDQLGSGKHIHDAKVGKWQNHFSVGEIEKIESVLNAFDISLREFELTGENSGASFGRLAELPTARKQRHQIAFLEQQLAATGIHVASLKRQLDTMRVQVRLFQLFRRTPAAAPLRALNRLLKALRSRLDFVLQATLHPRPPAARRPALINEPAACMFEAMPPEPAAKAA